MNSLNTFFEEEKEKMVVGLNIKDAYEQLLRKIKFFGQNIDIKKEYEVNGEVKTRMVKTRELIFVNSLVLIPGNKEISEKSRWKSITALDEYTKEITTAENPNDFTYTYGELLRKPVDQIKEVINILRKDKNSKQATMLLGDGEHLKINDPPCCKVVDLKYRDGKLNMNLWFRSHDITAYPANLYGFARLQEMIAEDLDMKVGYLGCTSNSLHLYEGDCDLIGVKNFEELDRRFKEGI